MQDEPNAKLRCQLIRSHERCWLVNYEHCAGLNSIDNDRPKPARNFTFGGQTNAGVTWPVRTHEDVYHLCISRKLQLDKKVDSVEKLNILTSKQRTMIATCNLRNWQL